MAGGMSFDAVVIGSGPNGLSAAITLAKEGAKVLVLEAAHEIGGGTRTAELTLPGFFHDVCSAAHPTGILSPFFRRLPLAEHGLEWIKPPVSVAHPLLDEPAVLLKLSPEKTAEGLGDDAESYLRLVRPFLSDPHGLLEDLLGPLGIPKHPIKMGRFGLRALRSAAGLAQSIFRRQRARALFAGCAAHAIQPLENAATAALGLIFLIAAHVEPWPVAKGGSKAISNGLANYLLRLGGEIRTGTTVGSLKELPETKLVFFDTSPNQLISAAKDYLPGGYLRRLEKFRYGPGVFKVDWALDGPIPWTDPSCLNASTVHVGGTLEEIASSERTMARGDHADRPFLIVVQQSLFDPSRAPPGKHTGYAYAHVPNASTDDRTQAVEEQIERFAPGFRGKILARHTMHALAFEAYNANYLGGAITGGEGNLTQLFTRPVARIDPYSTPSPNIWICSASTPPGGGVHGMCGHHAAKSALKKLPRLSARKFR